MIESTFEIKNNYGTFIVGLSNLKGKELYCVEDFEPVNPIKSFCLPDRIRTFKISAFHTLFNQREMDPRELGLPMGTKFSLVNDTGTLYGISSKLLGNTLVDFEAIGNGELVEIPALFTSIHPDTFKTHFEEERFNNIFQDHEN